MPTVPMMLGASAMHALSVEHHLRPVLIEIGASCPTRGLFMLEGELDLLDREISSWLRTWGDVLAAALRAERNSPVPDDNALHRSVLTRSTEDNASASLAERTHPNPAIQPARRQGSSSPG